MSGIIVYDFTRTTTIIIGMFRLSAAEEGIITEFSERLSRLIFEHNLNRKTLAKNAGISATCITHYLQDKRFPTIKSLICIADYFNFSTDFLLGREEQNTALTFKQCPPFSEQIAIIAKHFCKSYYAFYRELNIPESTFFEWKNGSSQPTLESILKIADHFDCRVDFILGRES